MAENKKVLTLDSLATIKELNDLAYQEKLENGVSIKTINGQPILGKGNIQVAADIDPDSLLNADVIASPWYKEKYYLAGTVVSYKNNIYKCTVDHSSSKNFFDDYNYGYWNNVSVVNIIDSAIDEVTNTIDTAIKNLLNEEF